MRNHLIIQIENQLQLVLHLLREKEVHSGIDRQADLLGHQSEEVNFLLVVRVRITPAQTEHTEPSRASGQRQCAGGSDTKFRQKGGICRKPVCLIQVENYQCLRSLMYPLKGGILDAERNLMRRSS